MNFKLFFIYLFFIVLSIFALLLSFPHHTIDDENSLRVMTYSSFIQKWGAGPEIAKLFEKETGIKIQWINGGHAGLLIERLKFKKKHFPDVVLGFDQFSIHEAQKSFKWLNIDKSLYKKKIQENSKFSKDQASPPQYKRNPSLLPKEFNFFNFIAYDWGPLGFVYRHKEIEAPEKLEDLIHPKYKNSLILQDPRMSSPGLQFLIWIFMEMGERKASLFLEKIKNSVKTMSPSWSGSYSLFKIQRSTMVFSYITSPYYHQIEEKNKNYRVALFKNPHPIQVEYAGIPSFCRQCKKAGLFVRFLQRTDIQKILMKKNYMYPVSVEALKGGTFELPKDIKFLDPSKSLLLIKEKQKLVNQWKKVFY